MCEAEGCKSWLSTRSAANKKQSPEEGIPEGGPIPLHRDTTINQAEYVIHIRVVAPQEYVNTYSTHRAPDP